MPRTCTVGERNTIKAAAVTHWLRVKVADADGTLQECSALGDLSLDLIDGVSWGETLDTPVATGTLTIRRDTNGDTAAPTMGASSINRTALGAYAPLFEKGRAVVILTATMAPGATPSGSDWKEMFTGRIDTVHWHDSPMTIDLSDLGAWVTDAQIQVPTAFVGNAAPGAGPLLGAVLQSMLDAVMTPGFPGTFPLYEPVTASWQPWSDQQIPAGSLLTAMRTLVQDIGWELRYRYAFDAGAGVDLSKLTLYEPDRANTTADWTIGPTEYRAVQNLETSIANIRNYIVGYFTDAVSGLVQHEVAHDDASIAKYGGPDAVPRFMSVTSATIRDSATMLTFLAAMLSDLSEADADQEIELPYFWPVQLGDVSLFLANGDHYDSDQTLAVVGYTHTFKGGEGSTVIQARGKVAGAYRQWLRRANAVGTTAPPLVMRIVQHAASAIQTTYRVSVADPRPAADAPITISTNAEGVVGVVPTLDSLVFPTDVVTSDLATTAFRDFVINRPDAAAPQGRVAFTAARIGRLSAVQSVDVLPRGQYSIPIPTLTTEAEGTALDGNGEGRLHLKLGFEFNTDRFEIYATESTSDLTPPAPDLTDNMRSGIFNRHEGAIASADDWATEADISTTAGYNRRYIAIPIGPTGMRGEPFIGVVECVDTGTPPSAPPSAFTVTFDTTSDGLSRATLAWTNGDVAAAIRVWRNGIVLTRLAAGTTTLVDTGISPDRTYNYNVQHIRNGQTSEFADTDGTIGTGTSGTPTLVAPDFVLGWPRSGGDDLSGNGIVLIRITNPDPLASTQIWMNRVQTDTGTFDNIVTLDPGQTDISLDAADYGTAATDESRWFYVVATRPSYTNSAASSHAPGDFGL